MPYRRSYGTFRLMYPTTPAKLLPLAPAVTTSPNWGRFSLDARLPPDVRPIPCMFQDYCSSLHTYVSQSQSQSHVNVNFLHPQIYRCDHLRVVLVSPPMSKKISCLESWGNEHTFVGSGTEVLGWRRLTCLGTLGSHPGTVRMKRASYGAGPATWPLVVRSVLREGAVNLQWDTAVARKYRLSDAVTATTA